MNDKINYTSIKYVRGLTEEIQKVFNNHGIIQFKLAYSPINKGQELISSMKEHRIE